MCMQQARIEHITHTKSILMAVDFSLLLVMFLTFFFFVFFFIHEKFIGVSMRLKSIHTHIKFIRNASRDIKIFGA